MKLNREAELSTRIYIRTMNGNEFATRAAELQLVVIGTYWYIYAQRVSNLYLKKSLFVKLLFSLTRVSHFHTILHALYVCYIKLRKCRV